MALALALAEEAATHGDVPVGAVVVAGGKVIGRGANRRERDADPTAHAEILALRDAGRHLGRWHLGGATLYVTLEPCPMCAGAMVLARVERLVFGAYDPKSGAAGSVMNILRDTRLNHQLEVQGGVLGEACGELLRRFFHERRS